MLPYFIVFFSVSLFGFIIDFSKSRIIKVIFSIFALLCFLSLYYYREATIGTDTLNYIPIFQDIFDTTDIVDYSINYNIEVGFSAVVYFLGLFSQDYFFIFTCLTAIIYTNLIFSFYRYKLSFTLLFASFFSIFQIYFYSFNILRQAIALSFLILAVRFLLDNRNRHFFLFCFFAFLFHYSSIFILLFYFIYKFRDTLVRFWYFLVFGTFFLLSILFRLVIENFDKYAAYDEADAITDSGGILLNLFYIGIFFSAIYLKKYISVMRSEFNFFLAVYGFYIALSLFFLTASFLNQGMVRISLYFMWAATFILLILLRNIPNNNVRYIVNCCYYIFLVAFTVFFLSNAGYQILPYRFR